jgi:MYND finger
MMNMWKWNLAFQCVVNIGVRGSEEVRTRVVEADMVPVIATILENYIKVRDRIREKAEAETKRKAPLALPAPERRGFLQRASTGEPRAFRRQAPPPSIEIPPFNTVQQAPDTSAMDITPGVPALAVTSPPERTQFSPRHHHHHHHHHHRGQASGHGSSSFSHGNQVAHTVQPLATAIPSVAMEEWAGLRPVRDADRLPSMVPTFQAGLVSQPDSPMTPHPPPGVRSPGVHTGRRRPSLRHQRSMSESDENNVDEMPSDGSAAPETTGEPMQNVQTTVEIRNMDDDQDNMLETVETPLAVEAPNPSETQDVENFIHRTMDGSIATTRQATPVGNALPFPAAGPVTITANPSLVTPTPNFTRYMLDNGTNTTPEASTTLAAMPRDEDVLMSLQLLAYVSKYCNLRSYFQNSHLVPKLKVDNELYLLEDDPEHACHDQIVDEDEEEFLVPDDFNIFPLVEKFTVRHYPGDMQYWAGVVMRNLCRKDDSRGGIRQCAYYECGKWEEYTRQFAKCRRCRRTKYCSKECQKQAWVYHRHWCIAAT